MQTINGLVQKINLSKSEIVFSPNMLQGDKNYFKSYMPIHIIWADQKNQVINFLMDRIWSKLKGWKEKNLSFTGRGVLDMVLIQVIPTYVMRVFLIAQGICVRIKQAVCAGFAGKAMKKLYQIYLKSSKRAQQREFGNPSVISLLSVCIDDHSKVYTENVYKVPSLKKIKKLLITLPDMPKNSLLKTLKMPKNHNKNSQDQSENEATSRSRSCRRRRWWTWAASIGATQISKSIYYK